MKISRAGHIAIVLLLISLFNNRAYGFTLRKIPNDPMPETSACAGPAGSLMLPGTEGNAERKSTSRAVLYSILMPGLGQYYLGEKRMATMFFISEAAIWTSFIVFRVQGHIRREGYEDFAVTFAGIKSRNHSDDFFKQIADFNSSDDYETFLKREGRIYSYPDADYEVLERYYLDNRVSDFEPWSWRSREDREKYYRIRWGSRLAYRRAFYAVALGLGNRVISAVFAIKSSRSMNSASDDENRFSIGLYPEDVWGQTGFGIRITRSF